MVAEQGGPSDTVLIRQAAQGDTGAFDVLVERHYRSLYSLAYRMLGNSDDASDAVQEAFVKAYRALKEFHPEKPLRPWLYKICANVSIDLGRARSKAPDPLDDHEYSLGDTGPQPEEQAIMNDESRQIHRAVAKLPDKYREIVVLRHFHHMDINEIAQIMNAPEGTVKSWLFRARSILRRELACLSNNPFPAEELAK
jgi:RNA polymerase sigma-70 factor (ECF subfamily)